jgi:hypothetical protein
MNEFMHGEDGRPVNYRDIQQELSVLFTTIPYFERPHQFTLPGDDVLMKDAVSEGEFCNALVWDVVDALDKNEPIKAHIDLVYGVFSHSSPAISDERRQSEALHSLRAFAMEYCADSQDGIGDLADDYNDAFTHDRIVRHGTIGSEVGIHAVTKEGEGAGVQYVIAPGLAIDVYPGSIRSDEDAELSRMTYVVLRAENLAS